MTGPDSRDQAPQIASDASDAQRLHDTDQLVVRRFALRAVLAGALGALGAAVFGATGPEEAAALAGPIEYSSTGTTPYFLGSNRTNNAATISATSTRGCSTVAVAPPPNFRFSGRTNDPSLLPVSLSGPLR